MPFMVIIYTAFYEDCMEVGAAFQFDLDAPLANAVLHWDDLKVWLYRENSVLIPEQVAFHFSVLK
ncbi:hypothetical protein P5673_020073 [Acropora cervicornis]|uniref:Uncharacterized protein n=1 Tax=Acropora cervicornis TaxID=6130 RepID=A0AAD9QAF5_ACRCE|nr:hypothetical protein P5673_020073 [Acropora cervicornis]